jgi:hypothetical protein
MRCRRPSGPTITSVRGGSGRSGRPIRSDARRLKHRSHSGTLPSHLRGGKPQSAQRAPGSELVTRQRYIEPRDRDGRRDSVDACPRGYPVEMAQLRSVPPRKPSPDSTAESSRARAPTRLKDRVARAAEHALAAQQFVSAIDVLTGIGWLAPSHVDAWRQGRLPDLESAVNAGLGKVGTALRSFASWAEQRGLRPSETTYLARTRDRRPLRFSRSGEPALERAYRTHWFSSVLSDRRRERLIERASRPPDLLVISPLRHDWTCSTCGGSGAFLIMEAAGPRCLACAELDHLAYLNARRCDPDSTRACRKRDVGDRGPLQSHTQTLRADRRPHRGARPGTSVRPHGDPGRATRGHVMGRDRRIRARLPEGPRLGPTSCPWPARPRAATRKGRWRAYTPWLPGRLRAS